MVHKYKIGSRAQVMHGTAKMTGGRLTKRQLKYNKRGKIVSRKASRLAKKNNKLVKAGYITKKGIFGTVKKGGMNSGEEATVNNTAAKAIVNNSGAEATVNNSGAEATVNNSRAKATVNNSGAEATVNNTAAKATVNNSGAEATVNNSRAAELLASVESLSSVKIIEDEFNAAIEEIIKEIEIQKQAEFNRRSPIEVNEEIQVFRKKLINKFSKKRAYMKNKLETLVNASLETLVNASLEKMKEKIKRKKMKELQKILRKEYYYKQQKLIWEQIIIKQKKLYKLKPSSYTTCGFEISISYKIIGYRDITPYIMILESDRSIIDPNVLRHFTHIEIAVSKSTGYSDLRWIIETDGHELELVSPTFFVQKNEPDQIKQIKQILYDLLFKLSNNVNNNYKNKKKNYISLKELFKYLLDNFGINFTKNHLVLNKDYKIFKKTEQSGKQVLDYLGDRKNLNIPFKEGITIENINDILSGFKEGTIDILYENRTGSPLYRPKQHFNFNIEAINIAYSWDEILKELNSLDFDYSIYNKYKSEYKYKMFTLERFLNGILRDHNMVKKIRSMGFIDDLKSFPKLFFYDILRLTFIWFQELTCELLTNEYHEKTSRGILTHIKGNKVWFKFDIIQYLLAVNDKKILIMMIQFILSINLEIIIKYIKPFISAFWTLDEDMLKNFFKDHNITSNIEKKQKYIFNNIYENFKLKYKLLTEKLEEYQKLLIDWDKEFINLGLILINKGQERKICDIPSENLNVLTLNTPLCNECIVNFGDYKHDFLGIRHDTYIFNALVIEYRNTNIPKFNYNI